jgi:hypothetical protein
MATAITSMRETRKAVILNIVLGNAHGIALVAPKDGESTPGAILWGPGITDCDELDCLSVERFRRWLAGALG